MNFPSNWIDAVSRGICQSKEETSRIVKSWDRAGFSLKEIENQLAMLAQLQGKKLVFMSRKNNTGRN